MNLVPNVSLFLLSKQLIMFNSVRYSILKQSNSFSDYNIPIFFEEESFKYHWKNDEILRSEKKIDANHLKQCVVHFPSPVLVYLLYRT